MKNDATRKVNKNDPAIEPGTIWYRADAEKSLLMDVLWGNDAVPEIVSDEEVRCFFSNMPIKVNENDVLLYIGSMHDTDETGAQKGNKKNVIFLSSMTDRLLKTKLQRDSGYHDASSSRFVQLR